MNRKIILASGSPRRRELLLQMGLEFEVMTGDCDENISGLTPDKLVCELSRRKALAVAEKLGFPAVVIGADTVVADRDRILGKPRSREDAVNTLLSLSGRTHSVFTGVTVTDGITTLTELSSTRVKFTDISRADAEAYADTGEPLDKAGSYGIQGRGGVFVESREGDFYGVVGLPICRLRAMLRKFGI